MDVVFETGVTVTIAQDGVLRLGSCDGKAYSYAPEATAMWIALHRSFGSVQDAATALAAAWETDSSVVRELIEKQVCEWQEAGLVRATAVRLGPR
ncbi:hypothetical protein ABZV75_27075 [Streptomyces flaveolus]|uniref:hypothetical protein n=1 Tax=Streptomyces flaveolus TaxID=67297 RepID=UPI0033B4A06F